MHAVLILLVNPKVFLHALCADSGVPRLHRIKELKGERPHRQSDAEAAAGVGKPDNGPRLRSAAMEQ